MYPRATTTISAPCSVALSHGLSPANPAADAAADASGRSALAFLVCLRPIYFVSRFGEDGDTNPESTTESMDSSRPATALGSQRTLRAA